MTKGGELDDSVLGPGAAAEALSLNQRKPH